MIELVLILHFAVILYVIFGFPVVLKLNRSGARYMHAATLAIITLLMILKVPCPITILEETLSGESYEAGFITTWLNRIIYVEGFDPIYVFIATLIFAGLVFSSFFWHPVKHGRPEAGNRRK
jgi:hypothetical protein